MRLAVSHAAREDLKNIASYTERRWGPARKTEYMKAIREKLRGLLRHPRLGAEREDVGVGYRALQAGSHVAFYRQGDDEIVIVRVLHQRMDTKLHLNE
jgi:toxin ParE1/3/4